jgi:hypothetical protein
LERILSWNAKELQGKISFKKAGQVTIACLQSSILLYFGHNIKCVSSVQ